MCVSGVHVAIRRRFVKHLFVRLEKTLTTDDPLPALGSATAGFIDGDALGGCGRRSGVGASSGRKKSHK